MADRFREYHKRRNDNAWLGTLVETMNRVSRPDIASRPCERNVIEALKAKLERSPSISHPSDMAPKL